MFSYLQIDMHIQKHPTKDYYEATGLMEYSNMTEIKEALGEEKGSTFLPEPLLNQYPYLKEMPIEELKLKTPLRYDGKHATSLR